MATQIRIPMPRSQRAKIFSMFDALKGLKEALAEKEKIPEPRRELAPDAIEELNQILIDLKNGQLITVIYYCSNEQTYAQLTGRVTKLDPHQKRLCVGDTWISFDEIGELFPME